jgi:hypothetical protein
VSSTAVPLYGLGVPLTRISSEWPKAFFLILLLLLTLKRLETVVLSTHAVETSRPQDAGNHLTFSTAGGVFFDMTPST